MSSYTAKQADCDGRIAWSEAEHRTWQTLYNRQVTIIEGRACQAFIEGVETLGMASDKIPQLKEVNAKLAETTGWSVTAVPAMITASEFFDLLKHRQFPAATFIRREDEIDYLQEPDIFHEFFGHCPMLTHPDFANFMQKYGERALVSNYPTLLARLFWFTVEFGLIQTEQGVRCYGGGILSSKNETIYAIESDTPKRERFELLNVLRTPYRVDQMQGVYFVIDSFEQILQLLETDLEAAIAEALTLPEFDLIEIDKGASKDEWTTC